jgi:TDG/mug DNA glycosylase family protein
MEVGVSKGFLPVMGDTPRVLILGTLPSVQSLQSNQYYGNSRNGFWPIVERIAGEKFSNSYADRLALLDSMGIALWDVYQKAERKGSLDSNISRGNSTTNDFKDLLNETTIELIACNGAAAFKAFSSSIERSFLEERGIAIAKLPSTSPAYAAMRFDDKYAAWCAALKPFLPLSVFR